jgi:hypothetical protein
VDTLNQRSLKLFHDAQNLAMKNDVEAAARVLQDAIDMLFRVHRQPQGWWDFYLLATLAYFQQRQNDLAALARACGPNISVAMRLLNGLARYGHPNYRRDYLCDEPPST